MTVRRETRRGRRVLVIDIPYTTPDGRFARFRRDATAATMAAARDEERNIRDRIAATGSPFEEPTPATTKGELEPSFAEVVKRYRETFMETDLKVTTGKGYNAVIDCHLLPRFGTWPISAVDGEAASELDLELTKRKHKKGRGMKQSSRNNIQIILRSVLSFARRQGFMDDTPPRGLPRLKRVGQQVLDIPNDEEVRDILKAASTAQRIAFALMAYAGLRPNEVRALRRRDVKLGNCKGEPGFISVRAGRSYGTLHEPKTGQREVPVARGLAVVLAGIDGLPADAFVATTRAGQSWGQHGLGQAFQRAVESASYSRWTIYCLRHYAITSWLRAGIPVHVVQRMAGHHNLATTERYVHVLKEDLRDAARKIGNMLETAPSAAE
jgi:integrase